MRGLFSLFQVPAFDGGIFMHPSAWQIGLTRPYLCISILLAPSDALGGSGLLEIVSVLNAF